MLLCTTMVMSFSACSDDENENSGLNQHELTLTTGQSAKLIYEGECTWESEEPLIAEVDQDGNVTAQRVGETNIYANEDVCKVIVNPRYDTYMEPCLEWGASKSSVRSFMDGYSLIDENNNSLSYMDYSNEIGYMYLFENNSLTSSALMASILSHGEELAEFLLERYVVVEVDETEYSIIMLSIDGQMAIGINLNENNGIMTVIYIPTNDYIRTKAITNKLDDIITFDNQKTLIYSTSKKQINHIMSKFKR